MQKILGLNTNLTKIVQKWAQTAINTMASV